jgi:ribosomal-protein-alanine N-acetyltransferase
VSQVPAVYSYDDRVRKELISQNIGTREMLTRDLDTVLDIEALSFPTPWSRRSFMSELTENIYAHYIVVTDNDRVVGYSGMWVIIDEAHVTNVAIHPDQRGRNIGEFLMRDMIERAKSRGATKMTLEVRVSNSRAQRLYEKLGFVHRGTRKGYYTDSGEDAMVMWLDDLGPSRARDDGVKYR